MFDKVPSKETQEAEASAEALPNIAYDPLQGKRTQSSIDRKKIHNYKPGKQKDSKELKVLSYMRIEQLLSITKT